jgi:23S rRNA pseudoU1915 N3-methylase RlmH
MKSLAEQSNRDHKFIFRIIQGIDEKSDFYKTLFELILSFLNDSERYKTQIKNYIKKMEITDIGPDGIKLKRHDIDYLSEIKQIVPKLHPDGENIVLLIDELPEVLYNLYKKDKSEDASNILNNFRDWRLQGFKKVQFILAGSIGIHYVIDLIDKRPKGINDLREIHCPPLDDEKGEVEEYVNWVTREATIQYNSDLKAYIKEKIGYFVPYFINLLIDEIDKICRKNNQRQITKNDIDIAFSKVVSNRTHFSDWKKRLHDYMPKEDFAFVNEILIHTAHKDEISIQEIYNKASEHDKKDCYMEFIDNLIQDGYITKQNGKYIFISPFLKEFWKNDNPVFNG